MNIWHHELTRLGIELEHLDAQIEPALLAGDPQWRALANERKRMLATIRTLRRAQAQRSTYARELRRITRRLRPPRRRRAVPQVTAPRWLVRWRARREH